MGGYKALKAASWVPGRVREEALNRVIELYEAWGKPETAAEWRKREQPVSGTAKPGSTP
jgi:hypothetical protein